MRDSLSEWLNLRREIEWTGNPEHDCPTTGCRDGFHLYLDTFAERRCSERAALCRTALARARDDAQSGSPLTFCTLAEWNRLLRGMAKAENFRTGVAFAKDGREVYGRAKDTSTEFDRCLAEANQQSSVAPRAARAYLDVLFFHPFTDGNARTASLAFEFLLERAGIFLDQVAPVFVAQRFAGDRRGALALVKLVETLVLATRKRSGRGPTQKAIGDSPPYYWLPDREER